MSNHQKDSSYKQRGTKGTRVPPEEWLAVRRLGRSTVRRIVREMAYICCDGSDLDLLEETP